VKLADKNSEFIIHPYLILLKKNCRLYSIYISDVAQRGNKCKSALTQSLETDMPCICQNDKPHQSSHDEVVHQHKHNHTREVLPCTVTYCVTIEILLVHSKIKSPKIQTTPPPHPTHKLQFHCAFLKIVST